MRRKAVRCGMLLFDSRALWQCIPQQHFLTIMLLGIALLVMLLLDSSFIWQSIPQKHSLARSLLGITLLVILLLEKHFARALFGNDVIEDNAFGNVTLG